MAAGGESFSMEMTGGVLSRRLAISDRGMTGEDDSEDESGGVAATGGATGGGEGESARGGGGRWMSLNRILRFLLSDGAASAA